MIKPASLLASLAIFCTGCDNKRALPVPPVQAPASSPVINREAAIKLATANSGSLRSAHLAVDDLATNSPNFQASTNQFIPFTVTYNDDPQQRFTYPALVNGIQANVFVDSGVAQSGIGLPFFQNHKQSLGNPGLNDFLNITFEVNGNSNMQEVQLRRADSPTLDKNDFIMGADSLIGKVIHVDNSSRTLTFTDNVNGLSRDVGDLRIPIYIDPEQKRFFVIGFINGKPFKLGFDTGATEILSLPRDLVKDELPNTNPLK